MLVKVFKSMLRVQRFSRSIPLRSGLKYVSCWLVICVLAACQTNPPLPSQPTAIQNPVAAVTPTSVAQATPTPMAATCADIDANWGQNWPAVLDTLAQLVAADQSCGEEPLLSKKYAAHYILNSIKK